ncbi:MAG: exodeoxyribonuclease VII large subunit [Coprobacillus sp.]
MLNDQRYISVFALNKYIKAKMSQDVSLQNVYIKGEISNYRPHPSGHLYFTLKDENSRVSAIMFSSYGQKLDFQVENGMQVLIQATVSVYEATGQYQLYVQKMQQDGIGNLYLQYEKLKQKLYNEGLFDDAHKKMIPVYPKSIAVLSAKQGAAVQDVIRTIHLRFPFTKTVVFPIPVQGKDAFVEIIDVLRKVDEIGFDTVLLVRGGGSIEDLWNFNEELLVRCVFEMKTPIITGIGHETDFTLCDFVSDYRAVTPTAAAMKATPNQVELRKNISSLNKQLCYQMNHVVETHLKHLKSLTQSYYLSNPEVLYSHEYLRLSKLQDQLSYQFHIFDMKVFKRLQSYQINLKQNIDLRLQLQQSLLNQRISQLDALSPLKVLQRGYTLVTKDNQLIKESKVLNSNDLIEIQFSDGKINARIE